MNRIMSGGSPIVIRETQRQGVSTARQFEVARRPLECLLRLSNDSQSGMLDAARSYGFKVPEESQIKSSLEVVDFDYWENKMIALKLMVL